MSVLYGTVVGMSDTCGTRRGSYESGIKACAQSYDGSVVVYMDYPRSDDGRYFAEPFVEICIANDSSTYGTSYFKGTIDELKLALELWKENYVDTKPIE